MDIEKTHANLIGIEVADCGSGDQGSIIRFQAFLAKVKVFQK